MSNTLGRLWTFSRAADQTTRTPGCRCPPPLAPQALSPVWYMRGQQQNRPAAQTQVDKHPPFRLPYCTAAYMPWNRCQVDAMRPLDPEIGRRFRLLRHMACTLHPSAVLPADTKKQPVQTLPPHTSPACHTARSTQGGLVASCPSLALFPLHDRPRGGGGEGVAGARHHEGWTEVKRDRRREMERGRGRETRTGSERGFSPK